METTEPVQSDQTEIQSDTQTTQDDFTPHKSADEYAGKWRDASAEAKKWRLKYNEQKDTNSESEKEKLQSEGKKDELITRLRGELTEKTDENKKLNQNYAYEIVTKKVIDEAIKMGCIDSDALVKLSDLDMLDVNDNFQVSDESVKTMLESLRVKRGWLFQKKAPSVTDGVPTNHETKKPSLKDLSLKQKTELLARMNLEKK